MLAILLLAGQSQNADALVNGAENRSSVPCGAECAAPVQARYRLDEVEPASATPRGRRCGQAVLGNRREVPYLVAAQAHLDTATAIGQGRAVR